jgi:hypothetical protein
MIINRATSTISMSRPLRSREQNASHCARVRIPDSSRYLCGAAIRPLSPADPSDKFPDSGRVTPRMLMQSPHTAIPAWRPSCQR